jgi:hypothetical protein
MYAVEGLHIITLLQSLKVDAYAVNPLKQILVEQNNAQI